ncbi:hypothetical protein ACQPXM_15000 [Kribbella sp. CA-253562]|uniref:hypothetical protein n=1 Tax=Kribbella sp. CA-253562 TaxID=3239942 RepID=UPI003D921FC6
MASAMARQVAEHELLSGRWSMPWSDVVVLERLARGGGTARWFLVTSPGDVNTVYDELRPGSCVSFYFSGGPDVGRNDEATRQRMFEEITSAGEIVLGRPADSGVELDLDIISGPGELTEYLMHHAEGARVVWGTWPAPLNDGQDAITVDLVDADGVLRAHPH